MDTHRDVHKAEQITYPVIVTETTILLGLRSADIAAQRL